MINLTSNYPYQPELNDVALKLCIRAITRIKASDKSIKILDVGCGYGRLLDEIGKNYLNVKLYGVEGSQDVCNAYDGKSLMLNMDLTDYESVEKGLYSLKFDIIIFSDVLEHIYDPVGTLNFYKNYLTDCGEIVITVPNIANIYSRISLLFGSFKYSETGVMDKTHIRFFTRENLDRVLSEAGLVTADSQYDSILIRGFVPLIKKSVSGNILDSRPYLFYAKYVRPVEELFLNFSKGLFSFRLGLSALDKNK